jgi:phage terminase large subunit GpA-like protein
MGLPHRPNHGKQLPVDILLARREVFPAIVPDGVALLTAGVDTRMIASKSRSPAGVGMRNHGQLRMTSFMAIWKRMNRGSVSMRT